MDAVATPATTPREVPDGVRVLLRGVSWDTCERLLADHLEGTLLPRLRAETIATFVQQGQELESPEWGLLVREWAQAHRS